MAAWVVILTALILSAFLFYYRKADLKSSNGINTLEIVDLGGDKQWVSIRGNDPAKPVLLFLHGGPGSANLAKLRLQVPGLEDHFVVVNWDQRGAGKSYHPWIDSRTLTLERFINDGHLLTGVLKERFHVDKIYLMGFSWGTIPGLSLAARYPEDYNGYIGVGQIVDLSRGEERSLDWVMRAAEEDGNEIALSELTSIDPAYSGVNWQDQLARERKWLLHYGGVYHTARSYDHEVKMIFSASEYSWINRALWPLGSAQSLKHIWPQILSFRFQGTVDQVEIPVMFISGRYDWNAPAELVEEYFQQLDAPAGKTFIWGEQAAHDVFYDEPDCLVQAVAAFSKGHR